MTAWSLAPSCVGPSLKVSLSSVAGEAERHLVVVVVDRRAGIDADVEGLVDRHQERDGVRDLLAGDLLAVDLQHAGAALAEAGSVVGEVEHDRVLARRRAPPGLPSGSARGRGSCRVNTGLPLSR